MSSASVTFDEDLSDSSDHELETDSDASLETDTDLEELYASFDFEDDASQASCTQTLVESAENIRGTTETLCTLALSYLLFKAVCLCFSTPSVTV